MLKNSITKLWTEKTVTTCWWTTTDQRRLAISATARDHKVCQAIFNQIRQCFLILLFNFQNQIESVSMYSGIYMCLFRFGYLFNEFTFASFCLSFLFVLFVIVSSSCHCIPTSWYTRLLFFETNQNWPI